MPVFLPGESHGQGQRSLAGYSSWGFNKVRHHLVIKQQQQQYKVIVIQMVWYWQRNRQIDNGTEQSPEMGPHKYSQLILDKVVKVTQRSKDSLFNKWSWNNLTSTCKVINQDTDLTSFTAISLKQIIDTNFKFKTIKLLEDNMDKIQVTFQTQ